MASNSCQLRSPATPHRHSTCPSGQEAKRTCGTHSSRPNFLDCLLNAPLAKAIQKRFMRRKLSAQIVKLSQNCAGAIQYKYNSIRCAIYLVWCGLIDKLLGLALDCILRVQPIKIPVIKSNFQRFCEHFLCIGL